MSRISMYLLAGTAVCLVAVNIGRAQTLNSIGINIAADGGSDGGATPPPQTLNTSPAEGSLPSNPVAGFYGTNYTVSGGTATNTEANVAIANWNDFIITRFKIADGPHASDAAAGWNGGVPSAQGSYKTSPVAVDPGYGSSAAPFLLMDSSGALTTAQVAYWQGTNTFATYNPNTGLNPDAQLESGNLGSQHNATGAAQVTIDNIPSGYISAGYNVYVYFNTNSAGAEAAISLVQPTAGPDAGLGYVSPSTYYIKTVGNGATIEGTSTADTYEYTDGSSSTTAGVYMASNFVEIPVPAVSATSTFTVNYAEADAGDGGITAIEIVPVPEPTSLALLLLGAAPAAWVISRRRKVA